MSKPKANGDSDLVKLVRELELRRQAKAKVEAELKRIADDLVKIQKYYSDEVEKLHRQREAANRDLRVAQVNLSNTEEVARDNGLLGPQVNRCMTFNEMLKESPFRAYWHDIEK